MHLFGMDLVTLIRTAGYAGIFFIVFAESGLFIGFFLPGDSLLFTAGFLASQGYFDIAILAFVCFLAAVAGDSFGYTFGRRVGPAIFRREDSILFHKNHLDRAARFYEAHGGKAVILARFMPVIRTFAPILAGVGQMRYGVFLLYNMIGAFLWAVGLTMLGYFLGSTIPDVDRYLLPIIVGIILLSVSPVIVHLLRSGEWREYLAIIRNRKDASRL
jgi:membrane-associated protein